MMMNQTHLTKKRATSFSVMAVTATNKNTAVVEVTVCKSSLSQPPTNPSFRRNNKNTQMTNPLIVKLLCRCSYLLLLYNLVLMAVVLNKSKTIRQLFSNNTTTKTTSARETKLFQLVQQTAFTNMVPNPRVGLKNNKRRKVHKGAEENTAATTTPSITLNLYDIYRDAEEVSQRSMRFPSIEQRLKVYLSTWYIPPCPNHHLGTVQYNYINNKVVFRPLHINDTSVVISSSAATASDDALVNEQRQLQASNKKPNTKQKKRLQQLPDNYATVIPNHLVYSVDTTISHERHLLLYNDNVISNCTDPFCIDVINFVKPSLNQMLQSKSSHLRPTTGSTHQRQKQQQLPLTANYYTTLPNNEKFPILFQFGDAELYRSYVPSLQKDIYTPMVPVLRKYRYSIAPSDLQQITSASNRNDNANINGDDAEQCYSTDQRRMIVGTVRNPHPKTQAIISIVSNYPRHFEPLNHVNAADIAWEKKLNKAVYRGALTGRNKADYKSSDVQFCIQVPRCNLVYQHGNSTLVDAMLVPYVKMNYPLSDPLNGIKMFGNSMSMEEMLQYKAIVMLEGNDVSSGLKWALFSNSVVLTQTPTCTSWAMEELLVPWVHYIPINEDLSDVEEKVQWILDHDTEAKAIARNGRLWIADLVYHPDADKENEGITEETMRRYRSHFVYNPSLLAEV